MFHHKPSRNFMRSLCVPAVAWLAMEISGLAQRNQAEQSTASVSFRPDARMFFALGMIESGNNDRGVGRAGEVSRYQIHPSVWRTYSESRDYQNPDVSRQVAQHHWNYLTNYFRDRARRDPTPFDLYVMWNTRFGHYARKGFDPSRLSPSVRNRAQRFVNLVNR